MQIIDPEHPFYTPLWRRVAIVAVLVLWFLYELLIGGSALFAVLTGGLLAYTAWVLLFTFKRGPGTGP